MEELKTYLNQQLEVNGNQGTGLRASNHGELFEALDAMHETLWWLRLDAGTLYGSFRKPAAGAAGGEDAAAEMKNEGDDEKLVWEKLLELKDRERVNEHLLRGLHQLQRQEMMLDDGIGLENIKVRMKAVQVDQVQCEEKITQTLAEFTGGDTEQALQTYTVSNREVRSEACKWLQPLRDELGNLMSTGTIKKVRQADILVMEQSGRPVEKIPSKLVARRKAPSGKRKARIVARGNLPERPLGEPSER